MSHGTHPPCCWSRRDIMADVMFTCVKTQNAFLLDHSKIIHFCRLLEWTHTLCFSCIIANFSAEHTSANRTNRAAHTRDVWRETIGRWRDLVKQLVSSATSHEVVWKLIQTTQVITTFRLDCRRRRRVADRGAYVMWRASAGRVSVGNDEFVVVASSWLGLGLTLSHRSLGVTEVQWLFRNLNTHQNFT